MTRPNTQNECMLDRSPAFASTPHWPLAVLAVQICGSTGLPSENRCCGSILAVAGFLAIACAPRRLRDPDAVFSERDQGNPTLAPEPAVFNDSFPAVTARSGSRNGVPPFASFLPGTGHTPMAIFFSEPALRGRLQTAIRANNGKTSPPGAGNRGHAAPGRSRPLIPTVTSPTNNMFGAACPAAAAHQVPASSHKRVNSSR